MRAWYLCVFCINIFRDWILEDWERVWKYLNLVHTASNFTSFEYVFCICIEALVKFAVWQYVIICSLSREQDEDLDDLSATVVRLGDVGLTIHGELSSQVLPFPTAFSIGWWLQESFSDLSGHGLFESMVPLKLGEIWLHILGSGTYAWRFYHHRNGLSFYICVAHLSRVHCFSLDKRLLIRVDNIVYLNWDLNQYHLFIDLTGRAYGRTRKWHG